MSLVGKNVKLQLPRSSLKVGILGAAKIVRKVWPALHRAGHVVTYVGCREAGRAEALVQDMMAELKLKVAPTVGTYEEVIQSAQVEVVYIPLPVSLRGPFIELCIHHGKHVVGEKPAAPSAEDLYRWLELMVPKRLLYMDGTMLTHSSRVEAVVDKVRALGGPLHIEARCSFLASPAFLKSDVRVRTSLEPHGALGDLGWYCIRWILHIMHFALPEAVSGSIVSCTRKGAISAFEGHLRFRDEHDGQSITTATLYCSFTDYYEQHVEVITRNGVVSLDGAISPTAEDRPRFHVTENAFVENTKTQSAHGAGAPGLVERRTETLYPPNPLEENQKFQCEQLWVHVGESLMQLGRDAPHQINPDKGVLWSMMAYRTQLVMDALLRAAKENRYEGTIVVPGTEDEVDKAIAANVNAESGEEKAEAFPFSLF